MNLGLKRYFSLNFKNYEIIVVDNNSTDDGINFIFLKKGLFDRIQNHLQYIFSLIVNYYN